MTTDEKIKELAKAMAKLENYLRSRLGDDGKGGLLEQVRESIDKILE